MSEQSIKKTAGKLTLLALGMFGFGFLMVPIYDVFCEITGLNGKTGGPYKAVAAEVDKSRQVKVTFLAVNNEQMPWEFKPGQDYVRVNPGEAMDVVYVATNTTGKDMVAQAVPSLIPGKAAVYFHKTECFCFNRQPLKAGETAELALRFIVDPDLPKGVRNITLSYTLFDVTEADNKNELASVTPIQP